MSPRDACVLRAGVAGACAATTAAPDGVRLRRLAQADADVVQAFVAALTPRSRYRRFFTALRELPPAQLAAVVAPADTRDVALGAFAGVSPRERLVGMAQCAFDGRCDAEIALVVADDWQGRGLGDRLLGELVAHARRHRVAAIHASAFTDNWAMLALAAKHGFDLYEHEEPGLTRMRLTLHMRASGSGPEATSC